MGWFTDLCFEPVSSHNCGMFWVCPLVNGWWFHLRWFLIDPLAVGWEIRLFDVQNTFFWGMVDMWLIYVWYMVNIWLKYGWYMVNIWLKYRVSVPSQLTGYILRHLEGILFSGTPTDQAYYLDQRWKCSQLVSDVTGQNWGNNDRVFGGNTYGPRVNIVDMPI